jgi:2-keto-4-pentenoate hydratase/2-oxohepta-3-ene-1,7-dioic acid hydratase in catechol pathway
MPISTETLDYEGEIDAIIRMSGFHISKDDAERHIWGHTIIDHVTAREKQRDHKQFYIGKSADTSCPMGPIAVPKEHLPPIIKVQTLVNEEHRQEATLHKLVFSIPIFIATLTV